MPPQPLIYSLSNSKLGTLQKFIDKHLNISFIQLSCSSHSAPILFIKKKDGLLQLCIDFQGLNKVMKKDRYPLPLITDLLDAPRKAWIYTKINLQHAYHLVWISKRDKWKMSFQTHYGSFEWLVMPFRLTNGPAAFQWFMNDIFGDLLDQCIIVYLNNILIYSNNPKQHMKHVWEVLLWLWKHSLYAKAKKCEWHCNSVEFLGYIMSSEGLTMADDEIHAILDWLKPWKVKDVQSCLGFSNFYWRFIHNYSEITVPLTRLTQKGLTWDFSEECCMAFKHPKRHSQGHPSLCTGNPTSKWSWRLMPLDYALVAILSTYDMEGALHPIALHSCTFTGLKLNYDMHDKELSAIFEAFKWWETLSGRFSQASRCHHWPQEPGILLHNKTAHSMTSTVVQIPVSIQPHHTLPSQKAQHEARCFN